MKTWPAIIFVNLIGYITFPLTETGPSEGSPAAVNPSPGQHSPSATLEEQPRHESSPSASSIAPHQPTHRLPTESVPESHTLHSPDQQKPSSVTIGKEDVLKTVQTAISTLSTAIGSIGDDLKSRVLDSSYAPHLQQFATASGKLAKSLRATASRKLNTAIVDPKKVFQIDQTDRDHGTEVANHFSELLNALKGIGDAYATNNIPNIKQAVPEIRNSGSDIEAKNALAVAIEKDAKTLSRRFSNRLSTASDNQTANSVKNESVGSPAAKHRDGEGPDGKASRAHTESLSDGDTGEHFEGEKSKEIPKQEPPKTYLRQIINGLLTIFPIHELIWLS